MSDAPALARKDFISDQDVRWCPGCGDYSILAQVQRVLPTLGIPREKFVFISGIGCSSRFPYYLATYGMHGIHGRAPALASGLKTSRPDLSVWVATGDGDALAIGGNHFIHTLRRNIGLKILLFNNRIYGLTKGQYSPTSPMGARTKSSPLGSAEAAFNPVSLALGADATFVARVVDVDAKHLQYVIERAARHEGSAFVEILQNCPIFNDGTWRHLTNREVKADNRLVLEHGKPMRFGKEGEKGILLRGIYPHVVTIGTGGVTEDDLLVHDEEAEQPHLAFLLSRLTYPKFPVPMGIFRAVEHPTYEGRVHAQLEEARAHPARMPELEELFRKGNTWVVE